MNEEEKRHEELIDEENDDLEDGKESPLKTIFVIILSVVMLFAAILMFVIAKMFEENSRPVQIPQKEANTGTHMDMPDLSESHSTNSNSDKTIDIWSMELSYYLNTTVSELTDVFDDKTRSYRLFKGWDETKSVQAILPEDLPFYIICSSKGALTSPACIGFYKEQSNEILSALNLTPDMEFEDIINELNIYYAKDKDYETAKEYEGITYYSVSYHVKQGIVYHFVADNPQGNDFLVFAQCEYPPIQPEFMIQNVRNGEEAVWDTASLDSWIGSYEYVLTYTSNGIVGSTPFWQYNMVIFKCQGRYYARFENNGFQMESSFLAKVTGDENHIEFHYIQECPQSPSYYIERFDKDELLLTFAKENDRLLTTWYAMADYHDGFLGQSGKITGEYYSPKVSYGTVDTLLNKYSDEYTFVDYQTLPKEQFYGCLYLDSFMAQFQSLDNLNGYNDFYSKFHNYFENNALLETFIEFAQDMKNGKVIAFEKYGNMQPVSLQSQIVSSERNTTNIAMVVYYEMPLNDSELEAGYSLIEFTVKTVTNTEGVNWKITDIKEIGRNAQVETIETDE